ncbi:hypothetical protein [Alkalihalobacillus sp. TS-13]|nr:hypothetical protein [Alkalihalobacillus sp. TS-13]
MESSTSRIAIQGEYARDWERAYGGYGGIHSGVAFRTLIDFSMS